MDTQFFRRVHRSLLCGVLAVGTLMTLTLAFFERKHPATVFVISDTSIQLKQTLALTYNVPDDNVKLQYVLFDLGQQKRFVETNACGLGRFEELLSRGLADHAGELWKFCFFLNHNGDVAFVDGSSPLIVRLHDILVDEKRSIAVLGATFFAQTIHTGLLLLRQDQKHIARKMLQLILQTPIDVLEIDPLIIPRSIFRLVTNSCGHALTAGYCGDSWLLLQHKCWVNPLLRVTNSSELRQALACPASETLCCDITGSTKKLVVMMSGKPLIPRQRDSQEKKLPYNAYAGFYQEDELPYISVVRMEASKRPDSHTNTPNLYDMFYERSALPTTNCLRCLGQRACYDGDRYCSGYFKAMCSWKAELKFISHRVTLTPPVYRRDPNRLVPRIIHQTWYEELTEMDYPNMSRLVESFKRSGWEYKFYDDRQAESFLATHFPVEVLDAYNTLKPGAFKADLFRYCVLLIHGGVYADVDILLESSLDFLVEEDIGFMVPMDVPEGCVWQGFIVAAPGHPFLALAVQTIVNQVRNRFTIIDMTATFCPSPNYRVLHHYDVLYSAGPCLLGASINRVLGRHGQTKFEPGELTPSDKSTRDELSMDSDVLPGSRIPGRTIVLKQDKVDMGAHRFTRVDNNVVVASTDLPGSDDRLTRNLDKKGSSEHYSKAHARSNIYGVEGLYNNPDEWADEEMRIKVDDSRQVKMIGYYDIAVQ